MPHRALPFLFIWVQWKDSQAQENPNHKSIVSWNAKRVHLISEGKTKQKPIFFYNLLPNFCGSKKILWYKSGTTRF